MQEAFSLMDGHGPRTTRGAMLTAGHGEFATIASSDLSLAETATRYEDLLAEHPDWKFPNTKPPGQLLFYMLTQRISNWVRPVDTPEARLVRMASFATIFWPLLAALAVVPLFFLVRLHAPPRRAFLAAILFAFLPNFVLITMHLDQALYPLLFLTALWMADWAARREKPAVALCAGLTTAIAIFVSFSMLALIPLSLLLIAIGAMKPVGAKSGRPGIAVRSALAYLAGVVALTAAIGWALNYHVIHHYRHAMAAHAIWKGWTWSGARVFYSFVLNSVEFGVWIGLPIALMALDEVLHSARRLKRRRFAHHDLLTFSIVAIFVMLALFGRTLGEVARLWIFMTPLACLLASRSLARRFPRRLKEVTLFVLMLQLIIILQIRKYMDFW